MLDDRDIGLSTERVDYRRHYQWAVVVVFLGMLLLVYRFFILQIVEGRAYEQLAEISDIRSERVPARRGRIFDRNGVVLATNEVTHDLYLTPHFLDDIDDTLGWLQGEFAWDAEEYQKVRNKVYANFGKNDRFNSFRVARNLTENQDARMRAMFYRHTGLTIRDRMRRRYGSDDEATRSHVNLEAMSHILGYMNEVNRRDLEKYGKRYRPGDRIGRIGIEAFLEQKLRGQHGLRYYMRDVAGQRMTVDESEVKGQLPYKAPVDGQDVYLTIDIRLQNLVVRAMRGKKSGAAIMMNPNNGQVLAMYSKPGFDPNVWSGWPSSTEEDRPYGPGDEDPYPMAPMLNKATTPYPPGSTYKVVSALVGLAEGVIEEEKAVYCGGKYEFRERNHECTKAHGEGVDLLTAIKVSCNVYFYRLGEIVGMDLLSRYGKEEFLLGAPSGIEIGEYGGRIPTKEWYRKHDREGWQPGIPLQIAVGQGALTVTPLQLARLYASIANGGTVYRPQLVLKEVDPEDNISVVSPEKQHQLSFDPAHLLVVRGGLEKVVEDVEGTAHKTAFLDRVRIAGKTGTAQKKEIPQKEVNEEERAWLERDHAWFVAYAPAEDPEVVVVVFLNHGGAGGVVAAPVARQILDGYFRLGIGGRNRRAKHHSKSRGSSGSRGGVAPAHHGGGGSP